MSHVMIRGANGRRHEVNFGEDELRVVLYPGGETVELLIEADVEETPEGRRRFALINIPRQLLSKALAGPAKDRTIREA